ncbi:MAG: DMT family transporter [Pseudomonadota bacterium]|nr:DMT family transporter [Pseudomonadota bacterium]
MQPRTRPPAPLDWGLLACLGVIWGGAFLGVELALDSLAPIWVSTGRITLAAIGLVALALITGAGLPPVRTATGRRIWLHCIGMGLFTNAIPFSLLAWGQQHVTSSFAGITMAVVPLLVLPLSHFLVPGERLTLTRAAGFAIGFSGVVFLVGGEQLFASGFAGDGGPMLAAQLACVSASCCYAVGSIITRLCPPVNTTSFAAGGLLAASVLILPAAAITSGVPSAISTTSLAGVIFLALFPTGVATILLTMIIQRAGPPFLSLVNYQVPVWAVLIGAVILSETIPGHFITALMIILGGLAVAQQPWKRAS